MRVVVSVVEALSVQAVDLAGVEDALGDQQTDEALLAAAELVHRVAQALTAITTAVVAAVAFTAEGALAAIAAVVSATIPAFGAIVTAAIAVLFTLEGAGTGGAGLGQADRYGLHALLADLKLVLDALAGLEVAETLHVDVVLVDEDVLTPVIGDHETIPATDVEPGNDASSQSRYLTVAGPAQGKWVGPAVEAA
jgi:hypothetical protein